MGESCVHLCVDMQRLFAEPTEWHTPWMTRVMPNVRRLVGRHPSRTVFTRFLTPEYPGSATGNWRRYYERWASMTLDRLGAEMIELLPELATFSPPAEILDKRVYSPWLEPVLHERLIARGIDSLVISGGETEVCVLSPILGAIDHGYRVVVAADSICSSADETHNAVMRLFDSRFSQQLETATSDEILAAWIC